MEKNELTIVLIKWADASGEEPGWLALDELEDDGEVLVSTVGFLIPADEPGGKQDHVTVMQSYHEGEAIHIFHVPVGMVRSMSVLGCKEI